MSARSGVCCLPRPALCPGGQQQQRSLPKGCALLVRRRVRRLAAPKGSAALDGVPASLNVITDSFLVVKDHLHAPSLCFVSLFVTVRLPHPPKATPVRIQCNWDSLGRGAIAEDRRAEPGRGWRGAHPTGRLVRTTERICIPLASAANNGARALLRRPRPHNGFGGHESGSSSPILMLTSYIK
jgi:hypothetical protein